MTSAGYNAKSLTEKPPAAPVRKIESIMGWHG